MNPLLDIIIIIILAFGFGLLRASTVCTALCVPALLSYFLDKDYTEKESLRAAILFNIPRLLFFILLGAAVGFLSFELKDSELIDYSENLGLVGYFVVSLIILGIGLKLMVRSLDEREDMKEGILPKCKPKKHILPGEAGKEDEKSSFRTYLSDLLKPKFYRQMNSKESRLFLTWGGFLALGCSVELSFAEGTLFAGAAGAVADNVVAAVIFGSLIMFSFGIGTAIPIVVISVAGTKLRQSTSNFQRLNQIKLAGASLSILAGLYFLFHSVAALSAIIPN